MTRAAPDPFHHSGGTVPESSTFALSYGGFTGLPLGMSDQGRSFQKTIKKGVSGKRRGSQGVHEKGAHRGLGRGRHPRFLSMG